jgi:hypothetical protein
MMLQAELFIKAVNAYKLWIKAGMSFTDFAHLYEAGDDAVMSYAKSCGISRNDACTQVYVDVAIERTSR